MWVTSFSLRFTTSAFWGVSPSPFLLLLSLKDSRPVSISHSFLRSSFSILLLPKLRLLFWVRLISIFSFPSSCSLSRCTSPITGLSGFAIFPFVLFLCTTGVIMASMALPCSAFSGGIRVRRAIAFFTTLFSLWPVG